MSVESKKGSYFGFGFCFRGCLQVGHYPSKQVGLALTHVLFFSLSCLQARVTQVGGLPNMRARVTLAGRLPFFLTNTPGSVNLLSGANFLIFYRPFECNHTLTCPGL